MPKRRKDVTRARIEFLGFWLKFTEKHDSLTMMDFIHILNEQQQSMLNICVQQEWKEAQRELRGPESRRQEDGSGGTPT